MTQLAQQIQRLTANLPHLLIMQLANTIEQADSANWPRLRLQVMNDVSQPAVRERLRTFLDFWQQHAAHISPESISLALQTAAQVHAQHREAQQPELVWTGPESAIIPLRRTEQVLLQLINNAQHSLHIVSFAVYKAQPIMQALSHAAQRGASISLYLETPDASGGKVTFNPINALSPAIPHHARLYIWPQHTRPPAPNGQHGSLHAKIALADSHTMLNSSANLTHHAMTLNMEMGLLVRDGLLPAQIEAHLRHLVEEGVFCVV